jgi:hypothetical protein
MLCPTCNSELTPKSKSRLMAAGVALLAAAPSVLISRWLAPVVLLACVIGMYLILWATRGNGLWCRNCKKAPYL